MTKLLKNLYSPELISSLCNSLKSAYSAFDCDKFTTNIFDRQWDTRELKSRMMHISKNLKKSLPDDYKEALAILKTVAPDFNGFEYMFFPGYVELYGLNEYESSMAALEFFTEFSSSEFAVRPFIEKYPNRMRAQLEKWAESDNYHVRRLASEGCRSRLPWAKSLPDFKKNPAPILSILEKLKDDDSEYVRRSVANNLNDISKDNPQIVIILSRQWIGDNKNTDKLVKHGCRSLLKQGNPEILSLFGFDKPFHVHIRDFKIQQSVTIGRKLHFSFLLTTSQKKLGQLRIEYGIDFMKRNGKQLRKIFKISEADYPGQNKIISRHHSFKKISTRKYYTGNHGLTVVINGQDMASTTFNLLGNH